MERQVIEIIGLETSQRTLNELSHRIPVRRRRHLGRQINTLASKSCLKSRPEVLLAFAIALGRFQMIDTEFDGFEYGRDRIFFTREKPHASKAKSREHLFSFAKTSVEHRSSLSKLGKRVGRFTAKAGRRKQLCGYW